MFPIARLHPGRRRQPALDGFLLPLSTAASLLLMLSSLSLQAAALQARSQTSSGQRLRQAEDALMSAAQHLLAGSTSVDQLAARVGETGQVGPVAYRLVLVEGPSWQESAALGEPQRGRLVLTLQQLATAEQPKPLQAAFRLDLARDMLPGGLTPPQLVGVRELGLRGRPVAVGAP